MVKKIFQQLRRQLNQYSLGFPQTESGVEIEILKNLFSEKEAALFTELRSCLETPAEVAQRGGRSAGEVAAQLENMAGKGLVFRKYEDGQAKYSAIPFIHGLLEFQLNTMDKHLIGLVGRYMKEKYHDNMVNGSKSFIRTIPVGQSVTAKRHVAPYNDAKNILLKEDLIVVTPCACRSQFALFDKDCPAPKEVCLMFGPMGQYYLDNHMGRLIGLDEAVNILQTGHDAGLVTQPATARKPFTMCNCCGCCCGFLRPINKLPNPADYVFSNYTAFLWQEACTGCGTCTDRCQMRAVTPDDSGIAQIDPQRCIGCGLCVTTCPEQAIELREKPEAEQVIPPADTRGQMVQMARNRGKAEEDAVAFGF